MERRQLPGWLAVWLCACGAPTTDPARDEPRFEECEPGALIDADGGCLAPGVDTCPAGFERDPHAGCTAVLPPEACPAGLMAIPGETQCRPVALCGSPPPSADSTQHVDASYAGGDSDGTPSRPWTQIQTAIEHAGPGGHVFVRPGMYDESLVVASAVTIEGSCPQEVVIRGSSANAVVVTASDVTLRGVSVTGPERGIWTYGASQVVIEGVRVFDTTVGGILVGDAPGTEVTLRDSLVENPGGFGVWLGGGSLAVDGSVIRGARGQAPGRGLFAHHGPDTSAGNELQIEASVIEDNDNTGVTFSCGQAQIEGTVIRRSHGHGLMGAGFASAECMLPELPTTLALRGSVLEDNASHGVMLFGVDAAIEGTTIRRSRANAVAGGRGLQISQGFTTLRVGDVTLSRSLIDESAESGVAVFGATLAAHRVVVRQTWPTEDYPYGHALLLQSGEAGARAHASVQGARLQDNAGVGVLLLSADAALERVAIDNQLPVDAGATQPGVMATYVPWDSYPSQLDMTDSDITGSVFFGVYVLNAHARVTRSRIGGIRTALSGRYGDGIATASGLGVPEAPRGALVLEDSTIEGAHRAGLASFGADVFFAGNTIRCNAISVNGESDVIEGAHGGYVLEDGGGNRCGCGETMADCEVVSQALEPLEAPPALATTAAAAP